MVADFTLAKRQGYHYIQRIEFLLYKARKFMLTQLAAMDIKLGKLRMDQLVALSDTRVFLFMAMIVSLMTTITP